MILKNRLNFKKIIQVENLKTITNSTNFYYFYIQI
jgi:hypothetical protein